MTENYKPWLPKIWGKASLWGEEKEARVHAFIRQKWDKESLKALTEEEFKVLDEWLDMKTLEATTPLDFAKFGEPDYVEKWIVSRCIVLKKVGTSDPLKYLRAIYGRFFKPEWENQFCWHVAHRIDIVDRTIRQWKKPFNISHKNLVREELVRLGYLRKVEN